MATDFPADFSQTVEAFYLLIEIWSAQNEKEIKTNGDKDKLQFKEGYENQSKTGGLNAHAHTQNKLANAMTSTMSVEETRDEDCRVIYEYPGSNSVLENNF